MIHPRLSSVSRRGGGVIARRLLLPPPTFTRRHPSHLVVIGNNKMISYIMEDEPSVSVGALALAVFFSLQLTFGTRVVFSEVRPHSPPSFNLNISYFFRDFYGLRQSQSSFTASLP